jgi:hypothetical protein
MKVFLLLSFLLQGARVALAQEIDCSFGSDVFLRNDGSLIFRHVTNPVEGTLKVEVVYEGEGWLGFGSSESGRMIGSDTIIGLPDEPISATNPAKYNLGSKNANAAQQLSTTQQTLQDASITQNTTHTVLSFTKLLVEVGESELVANGRHRFIWAVGNTNALGSYHRLKGSFAIDLMPCREVGVDAGTDTGTDAGTDAGIDTDIDNTTPILILGSGGGGAPNRQLWVAHGVLMSISWGILVPLAVGFSRLRDLLGLAPGMWCKIHQSLNMVAVICTIIGFSIAVYAINDETFDGEESNHFADVTHRIVGLVIFLLTVLQGVGGFLRPHAPSNPASAKESSGEDELKNTEHLSQHQKDEENNGSPDDEDGKGTSTKTTLRFIWECKHRFLGVTLLALAWYNCSSGIELFALRFGEEDDKRGAFWGVAAGLVGMIAVLNVYQKVARWQPPDEN